MSEDHESVYSTYRPTSAELRADAGNAPPGRFREEVRKGSTEDAFAETDPITAYVVGATTVTVDDWNELGHSAVVETQRYADGGSQTLTDDEDGAVYRRYWDGEDWSEWEEAGGGGGTVDHITPLALDAFAESDLITAYPSGISIMGVSAATSWIALDSDLTVTTHRTGDGGWQTAVWYDAELGDSRFYWRLYDGSWGTWATAAIEGHVNVLSLAPLDTDYAAEDDGHGSYEVGLSVFEVSDSANWNDLGHWGFVTTLKISNVVDQTLFDQSTGIIYRRYSNSGSNSSPAWSAWA